MKTNQTGEQNDLDNLDVDNDLRMGLEFFRFAFTDYLDRGITRAILKMSRSAGSNVISFPTRYDWIKAHQVRALFLIEGFQDIVRDNPGYDIMPPEYEDLQNQLIQYIEMADKAVKEMQCSLDLGEAANVDGSRRSKGVDRAA